MKSILVFKKFFLLFLVLLINQQIVRSQQTEQELYTVGYRSDAIINLIINYLPQGWVFCEKDGNFIIQRTDSVWILQENSIIAPKEKKEVRNSRIKNNGKKDVSRIVIRYENKWDFLKFQEANLMNSSIYSEIKALPEKMGISHLIDNKLSVKGNLVFAPKNEADKIKINNYYKEKEKLEKKLIKTPDHNTQKYSLFIIEKVGCNDENQMVYPEEASIELYSILSFMREVCGK